MGKGVSVRTQNKNSYRPGVLKICYETAVEAGPVSLLQMCLPWAGSSLGPTPCCSVDLMGRMDSSVTS